MAGVNGVEIKVGQVWRTRGGGVVTVVEHDSADSSYPWRTIAVDQDAIWVTNSGREYLSRESNNDLIELVKDEETLSAPGWTSDGKTVEYRYKRGHGRADIYAHKVVEEAAQADSATLAEETLSALGWTFDGQAWVEQPKIDMVPNALDVQVGGTHYKDCAIQPIEYIHANKLGFAEGNVVKYITRHRQKHGADDVKKVIHYCQLLLELEYGAGKTEGGA